MADLRRLFRGESEEAPPAYWEKLKQQSAYPDIIGLKSDDIKPIFKGTTIDAPAWMNCGCGMMVVASPELHGQATLCANCKQHQHDAIEGIGVFVAPRSVTLRPQTERRILVGLVMFALLVGGVVGARMMDAPPRAQSAGDPIQLD